jgi:hypothetical protein
MENAERHDIMGFYVESWSETEAPKRLELLGRCLNPDCVYTDPVIQVHGCKPLSDYMAQFQQSAPGGAFVATKFATHHDRALMHWNMVDGKQNVLAQGVSYFLYGADGRLMQMTGFFELPASD